MLNLSFPTLLNRTYDRLMKALVLGLQGHEKNYVGRGECLNKGAGCGDPQSLQHALNEIESLFANEVLVYQQ